jgi:hypothetical protein
VSSVKRNGLLIGFAHDWYQQMTNVSSVKQNGLSIGFAHDWYQQMTNESCRQEYEFWKQKQTVRGDPYTIV